MNGQPEDESIVTLLWDGEWEVTWVTFRDMGAAFAVALLGIYILVVMQFGSFKLPLVILTPIPLTFVGIIGGHWLFNAPFSAPSMIGVHRAGRHHRAELDPAGGFHPACRSGEGQGGNADRGRSHPLQADPSDRRCGHDWCGSDLGRPDFPGASFVAAIRIAQLDPADGSGDPRDLSRVPDLGWQNKR